MIAFETSIGVERPLEEVFAYVSDPGNFPSWNSAVRDVRPTSAGSNGPGSTYTMKRQLPTGVATNQLEIVAREQPYEFAIRTTAGPTPFLYRYRFGVENGETIVRLDAQVELGGIAAVIPQLARAAVKRGVDDNLATLKLILEELRPAQSALTNERRPRRASQRRMLRRWTHRSFRALLMSAAQRGYSSGEACGLLTDPTFDPAGTSYDLPAYSLRKTQGPAIDVAAVGSIDAVLLSHDHHFDNLDHTGRSLLTTAKRVLTTVEGAERLGGNAVGSSAVLVKPRSARHVVRRSS